MNRKHYFLILLTLTYLSYCGYVYTAGTRPIFKEAKISPQVREGKLLWQKHNCTACHQIFGLGGYMGPDLTNVISRKGERFPAVIIKHGTSQMPNFGLNDSEVNALVAFLKYIDSTGASPAKYRPEATTYQMLNTPENHEK